MHDLITRQLELEVERELKLRGFSASVGGANVLTGVSWGPNQGPTWTTFVRLSRLNDSATASSFPCSPILKNFNTRRSSTAVDGVMRLLRGKPRGRDESGNVCVRFESKPVSGSTRRPLPIV